MANLSGRDDDRTRKWDFRFMQVARVVSTWSSCSSRSVGAVLVRNRRILSSGYNGVSIGIEHCDRRIFSFFMHLDKDPTHGRGYLSLSKKEDSGRENLPTLECPRRALNYESGQGLHLCAASHAEVNAIILAAREGVCVDSSTMYLWCSGVGLPCKNCTSAIINAGIVRLVHVEAERDYDPYSRRLLSEANIQLVAYKESEIIQSVP